LNVDGEFFPVMVDDEGNREVKRPTVEEEKRESVREFNSHAPSASSVAVENGRDSPPVFTLSDDEGDENVAPALGRVLTIDDD
jgi:hypothetical protein